MGGVCSHLRQAGIVRISGNILMAISISFPVYQSMDSRRDSNW
jgi:hypothetical protein